jgi:hypothetical protein
MRAFVIGVILLFCQLAALPAHADGDSKDAAPLGLTWAMSLAEAKTLGIDLKPQEGLAFGNSFVARKLPKALSDLGTVIVSFGYDDKLWRVVALSEDFSNDPYGTRVIARYDELTRILADKYGKGVSQQHNEPNQFMKGTDFLYNIKSGKSWQYTDFETSGLKVQLAIGATDTSTGYWRIIFTNKALSVEFQKGKKSHEKDAL